MMIVEMKSEVQGMVKAFRTCKKLIGGMICALGAGIFLYAILPTGFMVVLLALVVVALGACCFCF